MKRRNFLQLLAALAGIPFLPKAKAVPSVVDPGHYHSIPPQIGSPPPMPVGTLAPYAGAKMPEGWLPCDGRAVFSRDYPELFEAIGYSYAGQPDHHSFNLPIAGPMVRTGPRYSEFEDRIEVSMESPFAGSYYIIKAK